MGKSLQFEWPISHSTSNKIDSIFVNIYQAHLEAASAWKQTHKERPETSLHVTLKYDIYGHKNIRLCLDKSQVIGRVAKKVERNSHVGEFGSTNFHIFHPWIYMVKMLPWLYHYTNCWSMAQGTIQCSSNATARGRKIESSRSADLPDLPRRMPTLLLIWKWQMTMKK